MRPEVLDRSRAHGAAHAQAQPNKAAKMLVHLRTRDIARAQERGDRLEVDRLTAIAEGIESVLSNDGEWKLCRRCGAAIKDTTQPGWAEGYGPECIKKMGER